MFKKIMLFLLAALVVIQFIRPAKNKTDAPQPNFIGNTFTIPGEVKTILAKACNDCHSNNTKYPWYSNLQPALWWMSDHIKDGKKELNFDEYTSRRPGFQYRKMEEVIKEVKEGEMPLNSYTWIHKDAILTDAEKIQLTSWAQSVMDTLKTRYPVDSLIRKK
jgi:Haem-binding domain